MTTNKDGTKTVISYRFNDDGKRVKTTRRIRTTIVKEYVNPRVAERKGWAKFGLEKGHAAGPSFDTTSVGENIIFRPSVTWKKDGKEEKKVGDDPKEKLKNMKVKCRICDGEHFTARCPFKDTMAPMGEDGAGGAGAGGAAGVDGEEDGPPKEGGLGTGGGGYVPPHLRKGGAAGAGERMGGKYERDDLATLRVTNVSFWPSENLFCFLAVYAASETRCIELWIYRSPNSQRRTICGRYSNGSVASRGFSWPRTGTRGGRRALRSSAFRSGAMRQRPVRRLMAVSVCTRSQSVLHMTRIHWGLY